MITRSTDTSISRVELKIFLIRQGWDQPTVARQLGITKQYLNFILSGKRKALHVRARMVAELGFPAELVAWRPAERRRAA